MNSRAPLQGSAWECILGGPDAGVRKTSENLDIGLLQVFLRQTGHPQKVFDETSLQRFGAMHGH